MLFNYLPWLFALVFVALFWWSAIGARAKARRAAQRACADAELRFIDELAFQRIWLGRDAGGRLCIKRRYGFEFYQRGNRRYGGNIEMHAQCVARVHLDPYPM
jgi:hypothetical protein